MAAQERPAPEAIFQHQRPAIQGSGPEGQAARHGRGGAAGPAGCGRDAGQAAHPGGRGLRAGGLQARRMGGTFWKKRRERLTSAEIVIKYCGKCDDGAKRSRQPEARGERCEPSAEAAAQATPERPVRSGTDDPPLAGMLRGRSAPERACSGDQGGTVVMIRP